MTLSFFSTGCTKNYFQDLFYKRSFIILRNNSLFVRWRKTSTFFCYLSNSATSSSLPRLNILFLRSCLAFDRFTSSFRSLSISLRALVLCLELRPEYLFGNSLYVERSKLLDTKLLLFEALNSPLALYKALERLWWTSAVFEAIILGSSFSTRLISSFFKALYLSSYG